MLIKLQDLRRSGTITPQFINILEEAFPDVSPDPEDTHDKIQQKIGSVMVVRLIKEWKEMLDNPEAYNETLFSDN